LFLGLIDNKKVKQIPCGFSLQTLEFKKNRDKKKKGECNLLDKRSVFLDETSTKETFKACGKN